MKKEVGISVARLIAMLFVIIYHILSHGGLLFQAEKGTLNYNICWFIQGIVYCAVNLFAIISGYVGVKSSYRYGRFISLWITTFSYAVGMNFIFMAFGVSVSKQEIFNSLHPITSIYYWYISTYSLLFLFIPILNKAIKGSNLKQKIAMICGCVLILLVQLLNNDNKYSLGGFSGHNSFWLIFLYIIGGAIATESILLERIRQKRLIILLGALITVIFLAQYPLGYLHENYRWTLIRNTSPLIVMEAVLIFLICRNLKFNKRFEKLINLAAPATFSIYLIHDHHIFRQIFILDKFAKYSHENVIVLLGVIFGSSIAIFIGAIIIDKIRIYIINFIGLETAIKKIEDKILGKVWVNDK